MKNISFKIINITLIAVAVMIVDGCKDLTDNLSTDPVNITNGAQVPIPQYISGVETSLIGVFEGDVARIGGIWSSYFSGEDRQYAGLQTYTTSGQDYDVEWVTIYNAVINNTKIIKQKARLVNNNYAVGVAQVMEAMSLGLAADLWGDVPNAEKAQYPAIATPKFDPQLSVYGSVQTLLDSAILNLSATTGALGTEDFFYNGDRNKWKEAAHTEKARLYLHTRDYANAIIQASQGISVPENNMMAPHGEAYGQTFNLYYSFLTYDRPGYMSANTAYAPTLLDPTSPNYRGNAKTNENGRFNYFYAPFSYWGGLNTGGKYDPNVAVGFDWGTDENQNGFFGATTSFPILTFQENQLILAESHAKLGHDSDALDALNTVRDFNASGKLFGTSTAYISDPDLGGLKYDPYTLADFAPGGMENADNVTANRALLREILEERYVTLIGQMEGFNDLRRTNNFLNIPLPGGKTDFPKRFLYSQIEVNTNPNVPKENVGLFDPVPVFKTPY
jgi:hypothetical protein